MIDLEHQVGGVLGVTAGGTGNPRGDATGVVGLWAFFPAGFDAGSTTALPYGGIVKLCDAPNAQTVELTSDAGDRALGVAIGPYDAATGLIDYGADTPAGGMVAIAHVGVADVLFVADASRGQFVSASDTDGVAQASDEMRLNSIGQLLAAVSAGNVGPVLLVNALGSLSAGTSSDIHSSYPGDVSFSGDVGLMADAGHVHLREPDVSALVTGTIAATATTAKVAHPASHAIDANGSTYWESDGGATPALTVDLGIERQIVRASITQSGNGGNQFSGYTLDSSNDGSTWASAGSGTSAVSTESVVDLDVVIAARYWRWTVSGLSGNAQVPEIDLRAVPYGPIDATSGVIPAEFLPAGGGGASALDDLTDVDAAAPADGDSLVWDAGTSAWVPLLVAGAAGVGVPVGGSTGQVLTKQSATDFDADWETPSGGGGGSASGALVTASAQSQTGGVPLTWNDPAVYDPDGYWNSGTPTRLTVPSGSGGRLFNAWAAAEINTSSARRMLINVNGTTLLVGPDNSNYIHDVAGVLFLNDGDYVEVVFFGGNEGLITSDQTPFFSIAPIG